MGPGGYERGIWWIAERGGSGPARRVGDARAFETSGSGGVPGGSADTVAGGKEGDGGNGPSSAGGQRCPAFCAEHRLQDRRRPEYRKVAQTLAGVETPDRSGALPQPESPVRSLASRWVGNGRGGIDRS